MCVRGNPSYGKNDFHDNGDGTITDRATGLMWSKADSGKGMNWQDALAWVQKKNAEKFLGHDDWRLPSVKELQSIVDYTRSPDTTHSPAIDPLFNCTTITNEARPGRLSVLLVGDDPRRDSWAAGPRCMSPSAARRVGCRRAPWRAGRPSGAAVSAAARRSRPGGPPGGRPRQAQADAGDYHFVDVHGAGAQRSDPKAGDPAMFPHGRGPQGDVIRIYNYVRLVRGGIQ